MFLTAMEYGGHTWRVEMKVVHSGGRGWIRFTFIRPAPEVGEICLTSTVDPDTFSGDRNRGTSLTEHWLREKLAQALEESGFTDAVGSV